MLRLVPLLILITVVILTGCVTETSQGTGKNALSHGSDECTDVGGVEGEIDWISFTDSVQQADLVVEVEMKKSAQINAEPFCKTHHSAEVLDTFVGNSGETISVLQAGTEELLYNQNEILRPGETYILFLRETTDEPRADYWI